MYASIRIATLLVLIWISNGSVYACEVSSLFDQRVSSLVAELSELPDDSSRQRKSAEMVQMLARSVADERASVSIGTVDAIAALLRDESATVRQNAAKSLGIIGQLAARALPALEAALEEDRAATLPGTIVGPGTTRSAILFAIHRIQTSEEGNQVEYLD